MWAKNDFVTLWNLTKGQAGHFSNLPPVRSDNPRNNNNNKTQQFPWPGMDYLD